MRLKHRVNNNSVKMYDKQGSVLRVETTINNVKDMKVYRPKEGTGEKGKKAWRVLRKGIADLHRRAAISQSANTRYLDAMACAEQSTPLCQFTQQVCRRTKYRDRFVRAIHPFAAEDASLLQAVSRGEFLLNGLRNRDLRKLLHPTSERNIDPQQRKRLAATITRKLHLLRAHGLIRKVPRTHRYLLSEQGRRIITALLAARNAAVEKLLAA